MNNIDHSTPTHIYTTCDRVVMNKSKYYVTMTDKYMSHWGMAENKINKLVLECDSYDEAKIVERNAMSRNEMKYINICMHKPRYNPNWYLVSWHNRTDYDSWYIEDYFVKRRVELKEAGY